MLGDFTDLGRVETSDAPSHAGERFKPELFLLTPSVEALLKEAADRSEGRFDELSDRQKMDRLFEVVTDRFYHSKHAQYDLFSNWLMYGLGFVVASAREIRDPNQLLKRSASGLCSQVSYVLVTLARAAGVRARHVGLHGHVVMEAWYEGRWHMYDPDVEVRIQHAGKVQSVAELARQPWLAENAYAAKKNLAAAQVLLSMEDNSFPSYPDGVYFVWPAHTMYMMERLSHVLKYMLPMFLIIFTLIWIKLDKKLT